MRLPTNLFSEVLNLPDSALVYELCERVSTIATDLAVLKTQDSSFRPAEYADEGGCELIMRRDNPGLWLASWQESHVRMSPRHATFDVKWRGETLTLVSADPDCEARLWIIAGRTLAICETFFETVCAWVSASSDAVSVFDFGYFMRDASLREEISSCSLERSCLPDATRLEVKRGVLDFFGSEALYQEHGIPWKRGVIFYGPPGNGKTQTIKAIVNTLKLPTIYVRSLHSRWDSSEDAIRHIYARARLASPSVVVLEDMDSLIHASVRSYFLNELDGFRRLHGVMTIATTNHLDKLDMALRDRPSRFDVKILFGNPDEQTREVYLRSATSGWKSKPDSEQLGALAKGTDGYSFAGLQELVRSGLMNSMSNPANPFEGLLGASDKRRKSKSKK